MRYAGILACILLCLSAGCRRRAAVAAATSRPAVAAVTTEPVQSASQSLASSSASVDFTEKKTGISLTYPSTWSTKPNKDYELLLVPQSQVNGASMGPTNLPNWSISLDVPDLPPHLPGMIPLDMVRDGYVKDLRKSAGSLQTVNLKSPAVQGCKCDMVRSTWHGAADEVETALLFVRGDHVYIIRARCRADHEADTRAVFDQIVQSIHWARRK
jgi:hypothetical protein